MRLSPMPIHVSPKDIAMTAIRTLAATAAALFLATAVFAEDHPERLHVHDAYARLSPMSGAIFLMVHNNGTTDDRLIGARTDVAEKAELHTHTEDANGVMKMIEIEGGIPLPAGEMHALERGSDHVMLMGLTTELKDGDLIPLTLLFESGAELTLDVPVDNERKPGEAMDHGHMHDTATN
jgi:periplasmic copper chaperone A